MATVIRGDDNFDSAAIAASKLTGALPAISGASLTGFHQQVLISDTTLSNTTSVEWSVNSDYIAYRCVLNEVFVAATGNELWIGASDDGGSTWPSNNHSVITYESAGGTNTGYVRRTSNVFGMEIAQNPSAESAGAERFTSGEVIVFCDVSQDAYARINGIMGGWTSANQFAHWSFSGHCDTADINTFRLYSSGGTNGLNSGRFTVYGVKL